MGTIKHRFTENTNSKAFKAASFSSYNIKADVAMSLSHIYFTFKTVFYLLLLLPICTSVRSDAKTSIIPAFPVKSSTQFSERIMQWNRGRCRTMQTDKLVNVPLTSTNALTQNDKFYMRYNIKVTSRATLRSRSCHNIPALLCFECVSLGRYMWTP